MGTYKTPGVYVEEISKIPPSVAGVATAIPAFIGITEKTPENGLNMPFKVSSILDFEAKFGGPMALSLDSKGNLEGANYVLYDSLRLFFDNGGGYCYIVSVANYGDDFKSAETFTACLSNVAGIDEITMVLAPDAVTNFPDTDKGRAQMASVQQALLAHCGELGDRVAILDVKCNGNIDSDLNAFRSDIGINHLSYGAAYYPFLMSSYTKEIGFDEMYQDSSVQALYTDEEKADIERLLKAINKEEGWDLEPVEGELDSDKELRRLATIRYVTKKMEAKSGYSDLVEKKLATANLIPPSGAIAGVCCANDATKGVWQSPANVSLVSVSNVMLRISDKEQEGINVDADNGKSVNAIRVFQGKGILVWGARTLDGFSNEWRYFSVRRFFNYVEESVQKSTSWAVFQPNDANTWVNVRCQIENFLSNLWRDGALAGATPDQAFYVKVGLGSTMTSVDVLEGKMIVEIGMAVVRPAEFIVLQFSHKLQES